MTVTALSAEPLVADRTSAAVERLREVAECRSWGALEWHRPEASAAFSRRDAREPGFADAVTAVRDRGFTPFIRPVGGRLAAYHEGALVLDVLARVADPRPGTTDRFRAVSTQIARGLRRLGVDAHVGELLGEYCPGDWSVHAGGRHKLVGTGQRLVRGAVLVTAVIVVGDAQPLAEVMTHAYGHLGLDLDPTTVGSVTQHAPGVTLADVEDVLGAALAEVLPLSGPDLVSGRLLLDPWDPR